MDEDAALGARMRARRAELGLTLLAVATEAGLSVPYVANLEKGRGNPTVDALRALAGALRIRVVQLVGDDEATDPIDVTLADLPPILSDYAHGKVFAASTSRIAELLGLAVDEARISVLKALAMAPRPVDRPMSKADCRRLLDAYETILRDPGDR